jgi:hypothetical protein
MSERIQELCGTTSRNKAIFALYEAGMKKSEIARQILVTSRYNKKPHPMSRKQIGQIIQMMQKAKENHGSSTGIRE